MGIGLGKEPQSKEIKDEMSLLDSLDLSLDSQGNSKKEVAFSYESLSDDEKEQFQQAQKMISDANDRNNSFKQILGAKNNDLLGMIGKALGIEEKGPGMGNLEQKQQMDKEIENDGLDTERE